MPNCLYYKSKHWKSLRAKAFARDNGRCVVPGCGDRAVVVDHIKARGFGEVAGPLDVLDNLQSLCRAHDNQKRAGGFRGCGEDGTPSDPFHPWNRREK